ncbi:MAG: rhodanese-like domain-containing protein [bacterium]|nr:rhodanese-like domain-containing protein [bacterium]
MHKSITREELKQLLLNQKDVFVIDVRSEDEYASGHIPFATNIPVENVEAGDFVAKEGQILVTACGRGGGRARRAAAFLSENSANEVYTLEGGSLGWLDHEISS